MTPNEKLMTDNTLLLSVGWQNTNCGSACCSHRERNQKGRKEGKRKGRILICCNHNPSQVMPQGDFNARGFVFFDNSQAYDWDAFPPICWFNRWKISSFELDQSGFFPWKKIFWVGFFLNCFGGFLFKKFALRLGNWKSICAQSNKRIECLFGVLYWVL